MFKPIPVPVIAIMLFAAASVDAQEPDTKSDPFASLKTLEGVWQGEGEGFGQTSKVTHRWERVLGGRFMRLQTKSIPKGETEAASVHEDVGYVSWSAAERTLRFRQFLSEGFVNTFRLEQVEGSESGFNFEPKSTEGVKNLAARMTLRFDPSVEYEMVLALGTKGKPLKPCQTMKSKKVE